MLWRRKLPFPGGSILKGAGQIVYARPLTAAHKAHFSVLTLNPVRWSGCALTQSYSQRQWDLPLNLHIMHSTQKPKLTGLFYCYSGCQLSTDKGELCYPLILEDLEKKVIIWKALRYWSNMYDGKPHREISHCLEQRSRKISVNKAYGTAFLHLNKCSFKVHDTSTYSPYAPCCRKVRKKCFKTVTRNPHWTEKL